ncbi:MAG: subclass B3 metallo-beta-lactamase [Gemmatimonadaceae bacterium]
MRARLLGVALLAVGGAAGAQSDSASRAWNQPVAPFRIVGNVWYVGAADIASYLITSPRGHVLIDGGFVETAPQILRNIRTLGFRPGDVRTLLTTHPHYDHAGGLARVKRETGARLLASAPDAPVLEQGGRNDFFFKDSVFHYPRVRVDGTVRDGDTLRVGTTLLTAHVTPGHTRGCTTWTARVDDAGTPRDVVVLCSASVPGYELVDPPAYPGIVEDYERTFRALRALPCDVPLAAHGAFFGLAAKRARAGTSPNPFVDPDGCRRMIDDAERSFRRRLEAQRARAR